MTTHNTIEEQGAVLLQNSGDLLPLDPAQIHSIAVIGGHADVGVLSGGGSAQVDAPGGNALGQKPGTSAWGKPVYFPSSPLRYIREQASSSANIVFNSGADPAQAARAATASQVAIVFVTQWMSEGRDAATLTLPDNQDALVAAVAAANPNTIVVSRDRRTRHHALGKQRQRASLNPGFPELEVARRLPTSSSAASTPSGKLPVTFAASDADLPHPQGARLDRAPPGSRREAAGRDFSKTPLDDEDTALRRSTTTSRASAVGYQAGFEAEHKQPLFPLLAWASRTPPSPTLNLKVDAPHAETVQLRPCRTPAIAARRQRSRRCTPRCPSPLPAEPFTQASRAGKRVSLAAGKPTQAVEHSPSTRSICRFTQSPTGDGAARPVTSCSKWERPRLTFRCAKSSTSRRRTDAADGPTRPAHDQGRDSACEGNAIGNGMLMRANSERLLHAMLAEGEGFEPPVPFQAQRFSRPPCFNRSPSPPRAVGLSLDCTARPGFFSSAQGRPRPPGSRPRRPLPTNAASTSTSTPLAASFLVKNLFRWLSGNPPAWRRECR